MKSRYVFYCLLVCLFGNFAAAKPFDFFSLFERKEKKLRRKAIPSSEYFHTGLSIRGDQFDELAKNHAQFHFQQFNEVDQYLNVYTGQMYHSKRIEIAGGKRSLYLNLAYTSKQHGYKQKGFWRVMPHLYLKAERGFGKRKSSDAKTWLFDDDGTPLKFTIFDKLKDRDKWYKLDNNCYPGKNSFINSPLESSNFLNYRLYYNPDQNQFLLITANGHRRWYRMIPCKESTGELFQNYYWYILEKEQYPSQDWIYYFYDKYYRISKIQAKTINQHPLGYAEFVHLNKPGEAPDCRITNHIQDTFTVHYTQLGHKDKKRYVLERIESPLEQTQWFHYATNDDAKETNLTRIATDNGPFLDFYYYTKGDMPIDGIGVIHVKDKNDYHINRLARIKAPIGENGDYKDLYTFLYHKKRKKHHAPSFTEVLDAQKNKMVYVFTEEGVIDEIRYYKKNSSGYQLTKTRKLFFDEKNYAKKFLGEVILDHDNHAQKAIKLSYDEHHNITKKQTFGNITGNQTKTFTSGKTRFPTPEETDCIEESYVYDHKRNHVLIKKTLPNGLIHQYVYHENTNYLSKEFIKDAKGNIYKRHFYFYGLHNLLHKEIIDDGAGVDHNDLKGVNHREIIAYHYYEQGPEFGFPKTIAKYVQDRQSNENLLVSLEEYTYNKRCQVNSKKTFDRQGKLMFSCCFSYDKRGRLIRSVDEKKRTKEFSYNHLNLLVKENDLSKHITTEYGYDKAMRLTLKSRKLPEGQVLTEHQHFDRLGRVIQKQDIYGLVTRFSYVSNDMQPISIKKPYVLTPDGNKVQFEEKLAYDLFGNVSSSQEGHYQKSSQFTILNQPYLQIDAKGNATRLKYDIQGNLVKVIHPSGKFETFSYDLLGRKIKEHYFNASKKLIEGMNYTYEGSLLKKISDHRGRTTLFYYDAYGQKIKEISLAQNQSKVKTFAYDAKGFLSQEKSYLNEKQYKCSLYTHDPFGKVIKHVEHDENLNQYLHKETTYDIDDNLIEEKIIDGNKTSSNYYSYNSLNQLVAHIDEEGRKTIFRYNYNNSPNTLYSLKQTCLQPNGLIKEITFDPFEQPIEEVYKNAIGNEIHKESHFYDEARNKIHSKVFVYENQKLKRTKNLYWKFDGNGNLKQVTYLNSNGAPKTTKYDYNESNLIKKIIKPSGIALYYQYTSSAKIRKIQSSDQTVSYQYLYDKYDRLIEVLNPHTKEGVKYEYDEFDRITQERLANNLSVKRKYDQLDRVTSLEYPSIDLSLCYQYNAYRLVGLSRYSHQKKLYTHTYTQFDGLGRVVQEKLIGNLGEQSHEYDISHRLSKKDSAFFHGEIIAKDQSGNIQSEITKLGEIKEKNTYEYDELNQLTKESKRDINTYQFDSNYNIVSCNKDSFQYNELDQITSSNHYNIAYDACGNIIKKSNHKGSYLFAYDALDRLIKVETEKEVTTFSYDYENRRATKSIYNKTTQQSQTLYFIYDNQHEIGTFIDDQIHQLKVNGIGYENEIGSAIAIELNGNIYLPISNLYGDIIALANCDGTIEQEYYYSSFGSETCSEQSLSPWRYKSKYHDTSIGLIFFNNRYYDPDLKKFISEDPTGFQEILQLYHYCLNNPLMYFDVYGLEADLFAPAHFPALDEEGKKTYELLPPFLIGGRTGIKYNVYEPGDSIYDYEDGRKEKSCIVGDGISKDSPKTFNGFTNGIYTTRSDFDDHLNYIKRISGIKPGGVYNSTSGSIFGDGNETWLGFRGILTPPVHLLLAQWRNAFEKLGFFARMNHICYSQGALHTYNALKLLPNYRQKSFNILALAPARYIPNEIAGDVQNVISRDIVPLLQKIFPKVEGETFNIIRLKPDKWYNICDHSFQSTTYKDIIIEFLKVNNQ